MFAELHGTLGVARRAESSLLAREGYKKRVLARIAIHPCRAVLKKSAVKAPGGNGEERDSPATTAPPPPSLLHKATL